MRSALDTLTLREGTVSISGSPAREYWQVAKGIVSKMISFFTVLPPRAACVDRLCAFVLFILCYLLCSPATSDFARTVVPTAADL
jgi:hypothetical protein